MTFINYASREINCKIVYYGPGLCGKTTNLQHIYDSTAPQAKGKLISLATETDRTLFFDFMPDSQEERMDANIEALYNLEENLRSHGYELMKVPYVLQLNKRDLPNVVPTDELIVELQRKGEPVIEAVAANGVGVFDTLKAVAKQVLTELRRS